MIKSATIATSKGRIGEGNVIWHIFLTVMPILCLIHNVNANNVACLPESESMPIFIDDTTHICCDGVYDKLDKHGIMQDCCKRKDENGTLVRSEVFSTKRKICCGGELIDLHTAHNPSSPMPKCCGHDYFYSENQICCNNKTYNNSIYYCIKDDCGETVIDYQYDVRCSYPTPEGKWCSKIHKMRNGYRCCGPDLMNQDTHYCFSRQPWPKDVHVGTCGAVTYDMAKNVCCQGRHDDTFYLMPMPEQRDANIKYLGTASDYSCLEGKLINKDLEHIAISKGMKQVVPNHFLPCGKTHYDPHNKRTQVGCCEGVVNHASPEMNVTCCRDEFIDLDKNDCCNNTKIEYPMLCCGGNQIYSGKSGLECCGSQLINNSYICCKLQSQMFVPVRKERGHDTCCGRKTYNSHSKNVCCAGKIIEVEQNETCVEGHILSFNGTDPKKVKEQVREMAQSTGRRQLEVYPRRRAPACLSCKTYYSPPKNCTKKFEYQLYIRDIAIKGKRTIIDVLFLESYKLRKTRMKLSTKGHCRCFQKDELYMLQTNRNMLDKVNAGKNKLRFSGRDVFRIIKGKFPKYTGQKCKIDRYHRKPIVS